MRQTQTSSHRLQQQQQHTSNATQTALTSENIDLSIGPVLPRHPLLRQSPPSNQQPSGLLYPFVGASATTGSGIELQLLPSRSRADDTSLSLSIGMETTMSSYEKGETSLLLGEREAAKRQIEIAELEFAEAKRIRQHARGELHKAQLYREEASRRTSATIMQITCHDCKKYFQSVAASSPPPRLPQPPCTDESTSLAVSYVSSAATER